MRVWTYDDISLRSGLGFESYHPQVFVCLVFVSDYAPIRVRGVLNIIYNPIKVSFYHLKVLGELGLNTVLYYVAKSHK